MIKISGAQMDVFDKAMLTAFNLQLVALFRESIPEATDTLNAEELLARVGAVHLKAKQNMGSKRGVESHSSLACR